MQSLHTLVVGMTLRSITRLDRCGFIIEEVFVSLSDLLEIENPVLFVFVVCFTDIQFYFIELESSSFYLLVDLGESGLV